MITVSVGANRVSCIDCAEAEIERLTAQLDASRALLAERDAEMAKTYNEAACLAKSLHKRSYSDVTTWGLCDSTAGIITQIDNMVAGIYEQLSVSQQENSTLHTKLAECEKEVERLKEVQGICEVCEVEAIKHADKARKQAAQEAIEYIRKQTGSHLYKWGLYKELRFYFGLEG